MNTFTVYVLIVISGILCIRSGRKSSKKMRTAAGYVILAFAAALPVLGFAAGIFDALKAG